MRRALPLAAVLWLAAAPALALALQAGPPRPPARDTGRVRVDTTKRDSLNLAPPDSMTRVLMGRPGYAITRYQGDSVTFDALRGGFFLRGLPALVHRDSTRILGDSIQYQERPARVAIWGRPGEMHDPGRGEPVRAYEPMQYFLDERRAVAGRVCTVTSDGPTWYVCAERGAFVTADGRPTLYGEGGTMTTDPDSVAPHYHFRFGSLKMLSRSLMVARPAVLYVGEVPVIWIPWLFQDMRPGRRSGILTPRFGFSEVVRNSPSYRRTIENVGFYFALSDYYDAQVSLDWRSGARPSDQDPGWLTLRGGLRYHWLDRFITGNVEVWRMRQNDGQTNLNVNWGHRQNFSQQTSLNANLAYAANTSLQRQTILNPFAATANIRSNLNYQTSLGPFKTSVGGSRTQFLGRDQVDQEFPTVSLTTGPIEIAPWLVWTPSFNGNVSTSSKIDFPSEFAFRYTPQPDGTLDSVEVDRSTRTTSMSLGTPFKAGSFNITASMRMNDHESDFPEAKLVIDPSDTSNKRVVVYERSYLTSIDWDLGMNLPQFSQGHWNLTPSVSLRNVDPGGFWVRSERSGADFVSQSKRVSYALSVSPTFFAVSGWGLGPFARFRHSVSPGFSYSYSPEAEVSDDFLAALGRTRAGYLGALAQNRVSFTLNQVFEAAMRGTADSAAGGRKMRLLSLNFSALEYDFERARATGNTGFATERFNYSVRSDLVPGLDVTVEYSLFEGSLLSDTARFDPYREGVRATLSLGRAGGGGPLARVWAWITGEPMLAPRDTSPATQPSATPLASTSLLAAGRTRMALTEVPQGRGFQATLSVTSTTPRPLVGSNVFFFDPRAKCEPLLATNPQQYEICLRQQIPPTTDPSFTQTTSGGPVYVLPSQTSISANVSFDLTPNWAASWNTSYDMRRREFASQIVSLQRDLKDWRAMFGFTQAPNGNFAFNFLLSLKPAPDIQLPYNSQSYRSTGATGQE